VVSTTFLVSLTGTKFLISSISLSNKIWSFVDSSELYYNSGYSSIAPFNLHDYLYYYSSGFVSAITNNRPVQVTVNVNNSVVIGSRVWNTYAFDTQSSYSRTWPTNSSLTLNLASNSYIVGKGGEGSDYYYVGGGPRDNPAYNGGYGMRVTIPTTITNNGTIAKGGGGGYGAYYYDGNYSRYTTGGGGAGYYPGQGGGQDRYGDSASAGTLTVGGSGSGGGRGYNNGGQNLGVAGYTEDEYYGASPAVTGSTYITWAYQGTVLGPINA
jgi:hypothetical protein